MIGSDGVASSRHDYFPSCLYGDLRQVKRNWRASLKKMRASADLSEQLDALEAVPVGSNLGRIVLSNSEVVRAHGNHWWLYIIHDLDITLTGGAAAEQRNLEFILVGLERLWFALGMLFGLPAFRTIPEAQRRDRFYRPVLQGIVRWLPEMTLLSERYVSEALLFPFPGCQWLNRVLYLCKKCGYAVDAPNLVLKTDQMQAVDVFRLLIEQDVLDYDGSTYRLR